ncbi:EF-hand domain-containing protein [Vibrio hannami]|uniref:EF-hand domain-containing protein n=1 Tax=Vibrio hannami TaxID=2717094 RepID=UPI0024108532|nr:EF-hand domain-containing protein [Vibrio hannami]MDG3086543.1 EF-hand domain-containing protein [Vibrio hannami]
MKGKLILINILFIGSLGSSFANGSKTQPDFNLLDTDSDGLISAEEFDAYRSSVNLDEDEQTDDRDGVSAFPSFDKDKDGFISESELASHAKYSNPGNGTGTLKTEKSSTKSVKKNSNNKSNIGSKGSGNSNRGSSSGNKGKGKKDR